MAFPTIVAIIVFISLIIWAATQYCLELVDIGMSFAIAAASFVLACTVSFLISVCIYEAVPYETVKTEEVPLVALQDNYSVEGGYFVFSGYIDEELTYTYMYETSKGLTTDQIKAKDAYIKESNEPKLVITTTDVASPIWRFFSASCLTSKEEYTLYLLPNAIVVKNQYNIDLSD